MVMVAGTVIIPTMAFRPIKRDDNYKSISPTLAELEITYEDARKGILAKSACKRCNRIVIYQRNVDGSGPTTYTAWCSSCKRWFDAYCLPAEFEKHLTKMKKGY